MHFHHSHRLPSLSFVGKLERASAAERRGGRARLNAADSKSAIPLRVSGVRIPPSPPVIPFRSVPKYLVRIICLAALLFPSFCVRSGAQTHRVFDANMDAGQLAEAVAHWEKAHNAPHNGKILVPMLDVYAPDGTLIYHGGQDDTGHAAQILNALPAHPSPPPSPAIKMSLDEALAMTPELAKLKDTILSAHHFVVISISMKGKWTISNPYTEQNHAVDSIPRRPGVDIDVIRINMVFPKN
jgi:hypothetical protein